LNENLRKEIKRGVKKIVFYLFGEKTRKVQRKWAEGSDGGERE
jgi:hypothetical protein